MDFIRGSQEGCTPFLTSLRLDFAMTTLDTFAPARRAPSFSIFSNILGNVISWNDNRVTVKMLSKLTDRELNDIGLERADISNWSKL